MNSLIYRARQISLALLVVAVVDHGHLQTDYSGSTPQSWGLLRLGRDIMRRAGCGLDAKDVSLPVEAAVHPRYRGNAAAVREFYGFERDYRV